MPHAHMQSCNSTLTLTLTYETNPGLGPAGPHHVWPAAWRLSAGFFSVFAFPCASKASLTLRSASADCTAPAAPSSLVSGKWAAKENVSRASYLHSRT